MIVHHLGTLILFCIKTAIFKRRVAKFMSKWWDFCFSYVVQMESVKKGVSKRNVHFLFLSILCWKKKKRKHEKMEKIKKKPRKIVFFGWLWRKVFFCKIVIFWKIGKHYLCSEGKKAFSLQLSVFGKCHFFWCPFKVTKHYKNRGFSRHGGKPKMALLVAKVPFWVCTRKGVLLSVMPKSCAPLKTLFL